MAGTPKIGLDAIMDKSGGKEEEVGGIKVCFAALGVAWGDWPVLRPCLLRSSHNQARSCRAHACVPRVARFQGAYQRFMKRASALEHVAGKLVTVRRGAHVLIRRPAVLGRCSPDDVAPLLPDTQVGTKVKDWAWVIGSTAVVVVLPIMLEVSWAPRTRLFPAQCVTRPVCVLLCRWSVRPHSSSKQS